MNAAIAQHLNIAEQAIIRIEEWYNVLFVVAKGLGARFVSKKIVEVEMATVKRIEGGVRLTAVDGTTYNVDEDDWKYEQKIPSCIHGWAMTDAQIADLIAVVNDTLTRPEPWRVFKVTKGNASNSLEFDMYNSNGRYYG